MKNLSAMQATAKKINSLSDFERGQLERQHGLIKNCEERTLSLVNTILIITACPTASLVGGFQQWKKKGRQVKKGEKAAAYIFVRCQKKGSEGESDSGFFITRPVWDIAQTEPAKMTVENVND